MITRTSTVSRLTLMLLCIILHGMAGPTLVRAGVIISDDFTGSSLDPAWSISTSGTTDYKYSVASSSLIMTDADPAATQTGTRLSAISPTVNSTFGDVFFTQSLPYGISGFDVTFDFIWDTTATNATNGPDDINHYRAMPILYITLLGPGSTIVAQGGILDGWNGHTAARAETIGGVTNMSAFDALPYQSSGSSITITRSGTGPNNITMDWTGIGAGSPFPVVGSSNLLVTAVQIQFSRFRLDSGGSNPLPVMGMVGVDALTVAETFIPEPTSLAMAIGLGGMLLARRRRK